MCNVVLDCSCQFSRLSAHLRDASFRAVQMLKAAANAKDVVLLLGAPGSGKSGALACLHEATNRFQTRPISLYMAHSAMAAANANASTMARALESSKWQSAPVHAYRTVAANEAISAIQLACIDEAQAAGPSILRDCTTKLAAAQIKVKVRFECRYDHQGFVK